MIETLIIKNFQSHKDTKLDFVNGINAIVGQSDSGKSAILRALYWVINNQPSGDSFRSHWGGDTSVTLYTNDSMLTRTRTSTTNEYCLNNSYFKALGGKVPSEVADAVNLNDINIQYQFDSPFLLSETPGQVASRLNKAINLDVIDRASSKISSLHREIDSNIKYLEKDIATCKSALEPYAHLDDIKKTYANIVSLAEELRKDEENNIALDALLQKYRECAELIEKSSKIENEYRAAADLGCVISSMYTDFYNSKEEAIRIDSTLNMMVYADKEVVCKAEIVAKTKELIQKGDVCESLVRVYKESVKEIEDTHIIIETMRNMDEKVRANAHIKEYGIPLLEELQEFGVLDKNIMSLGMLISSIRELRGCVVDKKKEESMSEQELHDLLPDVCPVCGNRIEKEIKV